MDPLLRITIVWTLVSSIFAYSPNLFRWPRVMEVRTHDETHALGQVQLT
jgi:hypothetical protein